MIIPFSYDYPIVNILAGTANYNHDNKIEKVRKKLKLGFHIGHGHSNVKTRCIKRIFLGGRGGLRVKHCLL